MKNRRATVAKTSFGSHTSILSRRAGWSVVLVEEVEARRLLTIVLTGTDLYISGTAFADTITVDYAPNGNVQGNDGSGSANYAGVTRCS